MQNGQASVELLAVFGIALLSILFFAVFASDSLADNQHQADVRQARMSAQKLAEAADYVYAQGPGATTTVTIDLPGSVDFDPEKTFIGKPPSAPSNAAPTAININIFGGDVTSYSRAPLAGAFPPLAGTHALNVTSQGGVVSIGGPLVSLGTTSLYAQMKRGESKNVYMPFNAVFSQPVVLNATYSWEYSNPSLAIDSPVLVAYNGPAQIMLAFSADSTHVGIYSGTLIVSAYPAGSATQQKEVYSIPMTVEVQPS